MNLNASFDINFKGCLVELAQTRWSNRNRQEKETETFETTIHDIEERTDKDGRKFFYCTHVPSDGNHGRWGCIRIYPEPVDFYDTLVTKIVRGPVPKHLAYSSTLKGCRAYDLG